MTDDTTPLPERDVIQLSINLSEQDRDRLRREWAQVYHGPETPIELELIEDGAAWDRQAYEAMQGGDVPQCDPASHQSHMARMVECWHSLLLLLCSPLISLLRCSHGLLNRLRKHGERYE